MQNVCVKCLYPSAHPFGLLFENGICSGCRTHDEKDQLDWAVRKEYLSNILSEHKKKRKSYDCVVPATGDAEDYYVLSKVLESGMSPLVVVVNDYFKNDIGWHNLHNLITHFDVDSLIYNPDKAVYTELVKVSLRKHNHVLLPFIQLYTSFPVHVAYERKIPLVVWGQNQAVEQVGKFSHLDAVEMSRWSRREHDLFDIEIDRLIGNGAQVNTQSLNYYTYPKINLLSKRGVRGIYLSNYLRWDPLHQNYQSVKYGFLPEKNNSSFDPYERAGSSVYYAIHDLLKEKRVGYRKITDHVAREIRHGRISTDEGRKLQAAYSSVRVDVKPFFDWLGVTKSGYQWFVEHRLKGFVGGDVLASGSAAATLNFNFNLKRLLAEGRVPSAHFVTFGKGI